jgi:hypothetical protein
LHKKNHPDKGVVVLALVQAKPTNELSIVF